MIRLTGTPVLETERLVLRAPEPRDAEAHVAFYGSDRSRFVGGPLPRGEAWEYFMAEIGHWVMRGFGMFSVTRIGDDRSLGLVGHWYPDDWPETEVGWMIYDPSTEGQGIAFEAAQATIRDAWTRLNWTSVVSYTAASNTRSIALAERLGAWRDPQAALPSRLPEGGYVFRHPKPEAVQ